jgi:DNA-directed RNA polymerase subunit M/transcription elongation factor TFIIS
MADVIHCPECQAPIRVREEQAGKKIRCPKCQAAFRVPADQNADAVTKIVDEGDDEQRSAHGRKQYAACPKCGAEDPKRIKWTAWGSFYGPALLCHVRCRECGHAYNGRSGRSNLIPAILFVSLPLAVIAGLLIWVFMVLRERGHF